MKGRQSLALRWPWSNLEAVMKADGYVMRRERSEVLGITQRTADRWKAGGIPDKSADHAAIAIGTHPALIWPDWSDYIEDDDQDDARLSLAPVWRFCVADLRARLEDLADAG